MDLDETLIALSICAANEENAKKALNQIENLYGLEMHSTFILSKSEETVLKRLCINMTSEAKYKKFDV